MAESNEGKKIKLTLKTPKEKKDVEVSEEALVKEVTFFLKMMSSNFQLLDFYFEDVQMRVLSYFRNCFL